jgi:hypothetical protein
MGPFRADARCDAAIPRYNQRSNPWPDAPVALRRRLLRAEITDVEDDTGRLRATP